MRIIANNSNSFSGINHYLKERYIKNNADVMGVQDCFADKNYYAENIVGTLPYAWFLNIQPQNREKFIKDIYDVFANYSNSSRDNLNKTVILNKQELMNNLNAKGLNVLNIEDNSEKGSYGRVYILNVLEDDRVKKYAYKIFYKTRPNSKHGNYSEARFAAFAPKVLDEKHSNIKKMYFADLNAGYILSEYITSDKNEVLPVLPQLYGFTHSDAHRNNFINGHVIDYGGFIPSNELLSNKEARDIALKILSIPQEERCEFWQKKFHAVEEKLKRKPSKYAQNIALALAASIPLLAPVDGKMALIVMTSALYSFENGIKNRIAITLSSILPVLDKEAEYDSCNEYIFKTLIEQEEEKIKNNIRLSLFGYHYLRKYSPYF